MSFFRAWGSAPRLPVLVTACWAAHGLLVANPGTAEAQTTRVSVASDGTQGNGFSYTPALSADGRVVAFVSGASNLVPGDTNSAPDIFVHDRQTGRTTRVSVASDGTQARGNSFHPALSADGRFVAFDSSAPNLVPDDTNSTYDIFLHDRFDGQTTRVSVASDGTQGNRQSGYPALSADGRLVAFVSVASNLVPGDTNGTSDIFVHDRLTRQTSLVSEATDGTQGNSASPDATLSGDGRVVAFWSYASNLVSRDTNSYPDIFVHDRGARQTMRVSVASDGTQGNGPNFDTALSADGRFVAFRSSASNLVPGDTNSYPDIFVHDRLTGQTTLVSVRTDGTQGNAFIDNGPALSGDGRVVAFESRASNLVPGDTNALPDIFVHDRATQQTTRESVASDGTQGNGYSFDPALSADGRLVAFASYASNLVPGDTNVYRDVFVRVLPAGPAPGPPANLAAAVRGSNATFTWSPPTTGGPVDTYVFHVGLSPGATDIDFATSSTATMYEATNVPAGTYYVRVLARNSSGTSPPSSEVAVRVGGCIAPAGPPAGLRASVSGNLVTLTWSAPTTGDPATSYLLEAGTAPGASNVFVGNVGNVTSLRATAPRGTLYARVKGVNACGTGSASNEVTFTAS